MNCFLHLFDCSFLVFFLPIFWFVFSSISLREFLHFFKGLNHLHKVIFKAIFFCFICIKMFRSCCYRTTSFWWCLLLFMLLSVFLHCCVPIAFSNWYRWSLCFRRFLFLQLVQLVTVVQANTPSGAGELEAQVVLQMQMESGL